MNAVRLDPIDRAFLHRFASPSAPGPAAPPVSPPPSDNRHDPAPTAPPRLERTPADPVVARLLDAVPEQWRQVADCIEEAHARGCRVFAITGARPGEGRTTLARGLVHVLQDRGRSPLLSEMPPLRMPPGHEPVDREAIVIVDTGIWFPAGPLRRDRLARLAFGCDAAVIVRRAERESCTAQGSMLELLGLRVLGEVVTFVQPPPPADQRSPLNA